MRPVKGVLLAAVLWAPIVIAEEVADSPSLELLEFLGEWSAEDQAWLDQQTPAEPKQDESKQDEPQQDKAQAEVKDDE